MSTDLVKQETVWESNAAATYNAALSASQLMVEKCSGPQYIANIQGKKYPKVEWWTTVGASLGLFPREVEVKRIGDKPVCYEAHVEVVEHRTGKVVTRASAICSGSERRWGKADDYAVRSMAVTRATGKAYRLGLSFIAVMAELEPTPAEEMPVDIQTSPPQPPAAADPPAAPVAFKEGEAEGVELIQTINITEVREGASGTAKGKPWRIHEVVADDGTVYATLDAGIPERIAIAGIDKPWLLTYTPVVKNNKLSRKIIKLVPSNPVDVEVTDAAADETPI